MNTPRRPRIAVYCGSKLGDDPIFEASARRFGHLLADAGIDIVYGGGSVGIMGAVANAALAGGSDVIGVIPEKLHAREVAHLNLTQLLVVDDMHVRKRKMMDLADAFVSLPGGVGTMEEFFESWSWEIIDYHSKPSALLNVDGYYDGLLAMLETMVGRGFVDSTAVSRLIIETEPESLIRSLRALL